MGWCSHLLHYQEPVHVEQLVTQLCDVKQNYTQAGGYRPFGVSLLYVAAIFFCWRKLPSLTRPHGRYGGFDDAYGFQLYQSDPSGNFGAWKATCIGSNQQAVKSILQTDYKEECSLHEALLLAVKVFTKTLDSATLTSEKRALPMHLWEFWTPGHGAWKRSPAGPWLQSSLPR